MAIKKIVKIANVGRLVDLAAAGDVEFRRVTFLYGSNGNGKTTLTSVLRSLRTGDPAHTTERAMPDGTASNAFWAYDTDRNIVRCLNGEPLVISAGGLLGIRGSAPWRDRAEGQEHRRRLWPLRSGASEHVEGHEAVAPADLLLPTLRVDHQPDARPDELGALSRNAHHAAAPSPAVLAFASRRRTWRLTS